MASQQDNDSTVSPPRKRKRYQYTQEQLIDAVIAVKDKKMSLTAVAKASGIPRRTLRDHVARGHVEIKKPGPPSMLTDDEEGELVRYIVYMARNNMTLARKDIRETIVDLICRAEPERLMVCKFNLERGPSDQWFKGFNKRHEELKSIDDLHRKSQSSEYVLDQFFNVYESLLTNLNLKDKPEQIFNCNETGLDGHITPLEKPCAIHDEVNCQLKLSNDDHMSAVMTVSASGQILPTMLLAQKSAPRERVEIPLMWSYHTSSKGCIDQDIFRKWFSEIFFKHCGSARPVLLLLDKHMRRISMDVLQTAIENEIHILGLPTNTTKLIHQIQPLDVGVFNLIKQKYNQLCVKTDVVPQNTIARSSFPLVWERAIEQAYCSKVVPGGFRRSGLYPFDPCAFDESKKRQLEISQKQKKVNTVTSVNDGCDSQQPSTSKVQENGHWSE